MGSSAFMPPGTMARSLDGRLRSPTGRTAARAPGCLGSRSNRWVDGRTVHRPMRAATADAYCALPDPGLT